MEISKLSLKGKLHTISITEWEIRTESHPWVAMAADNFVSDCSEQAPPPPPPRLSLPCSHLNSCTWPTHSSIGSSSRSLPDWRSPRFWVWRHNYSRLSQLLDHPRNLGDLHSQIQPVRNWKCSEKSTCAEHVQNHYDPLNTYTVLSVSYVSQAKVHRRGRQRRDACCPDQSLGHKEGWMESKPPSPLTSTCACTQINALNI